MNFGLKLKKLMKERGLNQQVLAEMAGVSQSNISDWMTGRRKPRLESIQSLAAALGVPVSELTDDSVEPMSLLDRKLLESAQGVSDETKQTIIEFFKFLNSKTKNT